MKNKRMRLAIAAVALLALLLLAYLSRDAVGQWLDLDHLRTLARDHTLLLQLMMLGVMVIQNLFTIIPLILVISINISLFGLAYGYAWSLLTSIVGALVCFFVVRLWLQKWVEGLLKQTAWKDNISDKGYWYVFMGRVIPFVPSSLINIAAGASTVKLRHFLIGTTVGNALYFLALSLMAEGLMVAAVQQGLYVGVIIVVAGYTAYRIWRGRRKKADTPIVDQPPDCNHQT